MEEPRKGSVRRLLRDLHHDLMNPLTVIVGYSQLLLGRRDLSEDVRAQIEHILEQAQECSRLMKNVSQSVSTETNPNLKALRLPNATRNRVLVVDDDPAQIERVIAILRDECMVDSCAGGDEALCRLLTDDFDLVLLSVRLVGAMQGALFFKTLVVQQPEVAARIILLTPENPTEEETTFIMDSGRPSIPNPINSDVLRMVALQTLA